MNASRQVLMPVALLVSTLFGLARAVTIDMITVGDPGNVDAPSGLGGVGYEYQIGKYSVTVGQYTMFLNTVAATDTHGLYDTRMATDLNVAGISRDGVSGAHSYSVINNDGSSANRPIAYVSWFDAARFANWMANGQPVGEQNAATTENGAYNLAGAIYPVAKNATNPNTGDAPTFSVPTDDEWYKAALYDPTLNEGAGGYWTFATRSDTAPGNVVGNGSNQANYFNGVYSLTQSATYSTGQNYLTDVGAFTASASYYGTFDQNGNLGEWNLSSFGIGSGGWLRGGSWKDDESMMRSFYPWAAANPQNEYSYSGFRLAAPVPEPSACIMALAGLACGGYTMFRRRKRT